MRHKLILATALLLLVTPLAGCGKTTPSSTAISIRGADGVSYDFDVEIADEFRELEHGLMERQSMPPNHGMIFLFPKNDIVRFWMKNTPLFLDMLFIAEDGHIAKIHHKARPYDESLISSGVPVRAVLEINGGMAKQLGLKEGDKLSPILW
ncbi:MAG TPA: DUF192 domain-containing protein [Alphaproteobacteria bacterium]